MRKSRLSKSLKLLTQLPKLVFILPFIIQPFSVFRLMSLQDDIEEITVTARKREERLLDVPVSAAALTAQELDRYRTRDLVDLTSRIPGLTIERGTGGGQGGDIQIRGIGNLAVDYGTDQPVSLVIDGMPFQRSHMLDVGFFDTQSVEVLKGPQALYFGKNSPAGVIGVVSRSPTVGEDAEGFISASYEFVTKIQ